MHVISFPGLGIGDLNIDKVAFSIGGFQIMWYGILIAAGLLLAMWYGLKRAPKFGVSTDDLIDILIFSLIFGIIGARLYYVIFDPYRAYNYNSFWDVIDIRSGGLGIYGGVIAAFLTAFIVCRIKKISTGAVFDVASLGFLIGQAVGRWGNFFNQEAYGSETSLPWGMRIKDDSIDEYSGQTVTVHPCFLYESLWCLLGFVILHTLSKRRRFNGQIFLLYIMWYSFGRFFIEILRTDSLMIGNVKISMLVAAVLFIAALVIFTIMSGRAKKASMEDLSYEPIYGEAAAIRTEAEGQNSRAGRAGGESARSCDESGPAAKEEYTGPEKPDDETEKQ